MQRAEDKHVSQLMSIVRVYLLTERTFPKLLNLSRPFRLFKTTHTIFDDFLSIFRLMFLLVETESYFGHVFTLVTCCRYKELSTNALLEFK